MRSKTYPTVSSLDYLKETKEGFPKRIFWKVISGPELTDLQKSDAIFDDYDLKIRKLK